MCNWDLRLSKVRGHRQETVHSTNKKKCFIVFKNYDIKEYFLLQQLVCNINHYSSIIDLWNSLEGYGQPCTEC